MWDKFRLDRVYILNIKRRRSNRFERFFNSRSSLIVRFSEGDITKKEFLEYNYELVRRMNIKPFLRIDSYEMGMYNYQYYNVLAKYFNMLANDVKNTRRHQKYYNYYYNKGNNYYNEKDKATLDILEFLEFKDVEAYYINVNSLSLRDELYEIVLLNYDEAIFHSKSKRLLKILKDKKVFAYGLRDSIIDGYINETY